MRLPVPKSVTSTGRSHANVRGQSLVELALILPVILLILLFAIDFGRIYLGWINLQNVARVAANDAANNAEGWQAGSTIVQNAYRQLVADSSKATNCEPDSIPDPVFPSGYGVGSRVDVTISCNFNIITPLIELILNDQVQVTASATFPIKDGIVGGGGGGGPVTPAPMASFAVSPTSGFAPLTVTFSDTSTGSPTSWDWTVANAPAGVDLSDDTAQFPTLTFPSAGTFDLTVTLEATNDGGSDDVTANVTITVSDPPTTGPVPEFSASPLVGPEPLTVTFTDESTGGPTSWAWDFDGDGFIDSSVQNPSHLFPAPGTYSVSLTVTDGTTPNTQTKTNYITVIAKPCTVPNFAGRKKNEAGDIWTNAGFVLANLTTLPDKNGGTNSNYTINVQSLTGGLVNPPGGCNATIEVGP